ncbi:MAG: hypothetical protein ACT4QC_03140 [Planctomycetaceae bacterium]
MSDPRIILHIGTPKSGTTTIQELLARQAPALLQQGILYPEAGRGGEAGAANHRLSWCINGKRGFTDASCWSDLRTEVLRVEPNLTVISAEGFEALDAPQVARVGGYLQGFEVTILVYLRNQWDFILSYFKQCVKSERRRYRHTLRQFLSENLARCDYAALIERWGSVFGKDRVVFRLFDKIKRQPGVEHDFLAQIGARGLRFGEAEPSVSRANVSPSDDATRALRVFNTVETLLPHTRLISKIFKRTRHRLIRRDDWTARCSAALARSITAPLYSPDDVEFVRNRVREYNGRFFPLLADPADALLFEF